LVNEAALAAGKGGHPRITSGMLDEAQDKILMGSERRHDLNYNVIAPQP
jgi:ATP-dependent Zn protease